MSIIYDLTRRLDSNTPVYPGDPKFIVENIYQVGMDSVYSLQKIQFCNHSGTHIDFPAHVIRNAKSSIDYPLSHLVGDGIIIEYPKENSGIIKIAELAEHDIRKNDIVFIKNLKYLEIDAAKYLLNEKVKIIGTDSISIDNPESTNLEVHILLLQNDILIVESLKLDEAPAGRCKIVIAPLNIHSDGAPARVFMYK